MKVYTMKAILLKTTRRNNSYYGNPAWTLLLDYDNEVIEAKTASDAQCVYTVSNYKVGNAITVKGHYTQTGNFIIDYIID